MNVQSCPNFVIVAGAQNSNVLTRASFGDAAGIVVYGNTVNETCVLQASNDGTTFYTLQSGSPLADVPAPSQGKALAYYDITMAQAVRIAKLVGNVVTQQTWNVTKQSRLC